MGIRVMIIGFAALSAVALPIRAQNGPPRPDVTLPLTGDIEGAIRSAHEQYEGLSAGHLPDSLGRAILDTGTVVIDHWGEDPIEAFFKIMTERVNDPSHDAAQESAGLESARAKATERLIHDIEKGNGPKSTSESIRDNQKLEAFDTLSRTG